MTMIPVNWYDTQWRTAIITKEGRKFIFLLVLDNGGVHLRHEGKPYPIRRMVRKYRQFGKDHGITKGAYRALVEEPRQRILDALAIRKELDLS